MRKKNENFRPLHRPALGEEQSADAHLEHRKNHGFLKMQIDMTIYVL